MITFITTPQEIVQVAISAALFGFLIGAFVVIFGRK